ncbi:MAG: hypothetical protein CSA18_04685 [Deltaproteobacteria bacterium]|nr:MAG: hypothetical protein CSA18_04685 [Deltaproteobacteria bacterium]
MVMFTKKLISLSTTYLLFCLLFLTASVSYAEDTNLTLHSGGCKTEYYLIKDLLSAYDSQRKVQDSESKALKIGNKKAVNLLLQKKIDFAFTCKPIQKLAKKLNLNEVEISTWESIPIAKDPIVIVSNTKNGVDNISKEQLADIFQRKIKNWKTLGGKKLKIRSFYLSPKVQSGILPLFEEFIGAKLSKHSKTKNKPSALGELVSKIPGSITFMAFNSYREDYGKLLSIDGVKPSTKTILSGEYPLSTTYYLTIDSNSEDRDEDRMKTVSDFVDFCLSKKGKKEIQKKYIPYSK